MPISSVADVAKVIIQLSPSPISNLKLQKLLYYTQGWSLALYDKPAFEGRIEAWVHGPVVPSVFFSYRHHGWNNIPKPTDVITMPDEEVAHINNILDMHGKYSATQLEAASHKESPWLEARRDLDPRTPSNALISLEALKAYFTALNNA